MQKFTKWKYTGHYSVRNTFRSQNHEINLLFSDCQRNKSILTICILFATLNRVIFVGNK